MTTPNPIKLVFTEEQLANLNALVERETKHAFDEIAEGIARATQEFAECFADIPLPDGTTLERALRCSARSGGLLFLVM